MASSHIIALLDLVGYSKNNEHAQFSFFKEFQRQVHYVLYDEIIEGKCILIITGDGVIVGLENRLMEKTFLKAFELIRAISDWLAPTNGQVRSAIHVGDVNVLSDINRMKNMVGNTVNEAARLLGGANDDGGIVISKAFHDKFLRKYPYIIGEKTAITDNWLFQINDDQAIFDKHLFKHDAYSILIFHKDSPEQMEKTYGSYDKLTSKFSANVYSTDHPKKEVFDNFLRTKIERASDLDFVGIYNPNIPLILSKINFHSGRKINITITYAADSLIDEIGGFFPKSDENIEIERKVESIEKVKNWAAEAKKHNNIRIRLFEYNKFLPFGASLIDKDIQGRGFIHISNYFRNVSPKDTPYIEVGWQTQTKPPLYEFYHEYIKNMLDCNTNLNEIPI